MLQNPEMKIQLFEDVEDFVYNCHSDDLVSREAVFVDIVYPRRFRLALKFKDWNPWIRCRKVMRLEG